jgi:hypothetical protein
MKVRMRTTAAGPNGNHIAGQIADVSNETAAAWLKEGYAVPAGPETTTKQAVAKVAAASNDKKTVSK